MLYGVCGDPEMAYAAAAAGLDFAEWSVGAALQPLEGEEAFLKTLEQMRSADVPFLAFNCFVPGDLKITGPEADMDALEEYVSTVMARAERTDAEVVVFGSGSARAVPDGFDRDRAREQLVSFASMASSVAGDHGMSIVVEPLNKGACNVLTTVAECGELVRDVDHPACRLLVDAYHHMTDGDSFEDIVEYGDLLGHVHIATVENRVAPGAEECDFTRFFDALQRAGYDGRISIEASVPEPEEELPRALRVMQGYVA